MSKPTTVRAVEEKLAESLRRGRFNIDEAFRKHGEDSIEFMYAKGWCEAIEGCLGMINPNHPDLC